MNNDSVYRYHLQNVFHTLLLLSGMLLLVGSIGWLIAGAVGVAWSLFMGSMLAITAPRLSPHLILYLYGARLLTNKLFDPLLEVISWLTVKGDLPQTPSLYYIPNSAMLAFTVGMKNNTSIVISEGLLRQLNIRELTAVLAHEVSHIKSNDLWVMSVADTFSRLTSILALIAYMMIIFYIPLFIFEGLEIPYALIILLILAPTASSLMQLALSRTREFNADMQAIKLTDDPDGLISALLKIDQYEKNILKQMFLPNVGSSGPSLLRTHPVTEERIQRLILITESNLQSFNNLEKQSILGNAKIHRKPKRHISDLWH